MKLSIVIPAHNEGGCIENTIRALHDKLSAERVEHEILVVNDGSSDNTGDIVLQLQNEITTLNCVVNPGPHGFGFAVRKGLECFSGEAVAVYMADASDTPEDLVRFFRAMEERSVDCVFGTRFANGARVTGYPRFKLVLNRLANTFIKVLFGFRYNDVTNAFKLYRRHVIEGLQPLLSHHFNLTVELPLKSIVRGYSYAVLPNDWINRKTGTSKLIVQEMGSRYLFIVLYCFIEKWLSMKDYHRTKSQELPESRSSQAAFKDVDIRTR